MVIVNKKPPLKKVPLLLFQFPNPPTWNNWLSHILNLYSFVIYLYSSSSHVLTISLCLLIFFFLLFFFFFFSLIRPHEVEEWRPTAHSSLFQQPYRSYQSISTPVFTKIRLNWHESRKKKGKSVHRTPHQDKSGTGVETMKPHPCFLGYSPLSFLYACLVPIWVGILVLGWSC